MNLTLVHVHVHAHVHAHVHVHVRVLMSRIICPPRFCAQSVHV